MRLLKTFEEFRTIGVVAPKPPELARARSLALGSEKRMKFFGELLEKIGISDDNANYFIENSYDILIEMLRAKIILSGFYASGERAHEAEVSFMRNIGFPEKDVMLMDELRFHTNGIKYYGRNFDKEYANSVIVFMKKIYPKLKSMLKN